MSQWAQRPAMDRFLDGRAASDENYIVNIFICIMSSLSSKNLPIKFVEKTSHFWALCPLRHLFYSFRRTKSQSFRRFDGKLFLIHFVRGPLHYLKPVTPKTYPTYIIDVFFLAEHDLGNSLRLLVQ